MSKTLALALAVATVGLAFPTGTADTAWTFSLSGTNADGTAYADSVDSNVPTVNHDVPAGATGVVLIVSKNGISSLPSDPFDVPADTTAPVTITLTVPDATQKATIVVSVPVADPVTTNPATDSAATDMTAAADPAPATDTAAPAATA